MNKLLDSLHERITVCKERIYLKTWELSKNETAKTIFELQCKYHRECYDDATNKTTIGRLRASLNHENFYRVSDTCSIPETSKRVTRSSLDYFDKEKCFFCQLDTTRSLIHLGTFYRSDMMKRAINIANNDVLRIRYNSALDAHAGDVQYHSSCMVINIDKILYSIQDGEDKETD